MEKDTLILIVIGFITLLFIILEFFLKWKVIKFFIKLIKKCAKYFYQSYCLMFLRKKDKILFLLFSKRELGYRQLFFAEKTINPDSRTIESCVKSILKLVKVGFIENSIKTGGQQDLQDEIYKITARGNRKSKKIGERYQVTIAKLIQEISKIEPGPLIKVQKNKAHELVENIIFCFECPEDIDLPDEAEQIQVKAICRNCSIPLNEIHGPVGLYSAIEEYRCPSCMTTTDSEIFDRNKSQAMSIFIKKKLGIPLGTAADERY